jgi:hypothetical protein
LFVVVVVVVVVVVIIILLLLSHLCGRGKISKLRVSLMKSEAPLLLYP